MTKFDRKLQKVNAHLEKLHENPPVVAETPVARFNEGKFEDGGNIPAPTLTEDMVVDTEGYRERDEKAIRHLSESGEWTPPDPREYAKQLREQQAAGRVTVIDSIGHVPSDFNPQPDRSHKAERQRKAQQKKLAKFYRNQHHIARHMP